MTKETHLAAVAAIQFALTNPEGMEFLRLWNEGEFDALRRQWPEAPDSVYIGAEDVARPKRRPYNASGSLSEYGVFPECDVQQPADARRLIAKLAAHVRPTCSELWDEAQAFLATGDECHCGKEKRGPLAHSRNVIRQSLHWHGVPVHVTGTVTTSPGNWSLIDAALATQHREPTDDR